MLLKKIAYIRSDFTQKFGIPRQSGIVRELEAEIIFEPEYRNPDALRGLDGFSHIWLLWGFSENINDKGDWSATVRPPRLGGNIRMGVFATRSPFRPNPLGLSCVTLNSIEKTASYGEILHIGGADLMNGTPIFDIKPYIPFIDCRTDATGGFASAPDDTLNVDFPYDLLVSIPQSKRDALIGVLAQDPRPAYQNDPERVYGFPFAGFEVSFTVSDRVLHVVSVSPTL